MNIDTLTTKAAAITCARCAMSFAVPTEFDRHRRDDHKTFYCPAGHHNYYPGKSEAEKLRADLEREKRCCELNRARAAHLEEQVEHRERQVNGYRGALAKAKKRSVTA